MRKLGVLGLTVAAGMVAGLLSAREATAQDFGQQWVDRVTHELEQERGPLSPKPFTWDAEAGVNYAYDSNVFLTQTNKKSDSIIIPFVQAGLQYGEPRFDLEGNLLADYKGYLKEHASGDEERAYFRARQTSSRWNFEIAEIFQNIIDPSGVQFLTRTRHLVSNTIPKVAFDLGRSWAIEGTGNVQIVRFREQAYTPEENNNFSVDATGVYRTPWAFDLLAQVGYYNIHYTLPQADGGTPGAFGYYYRLGVRGDLFEKLHVNVLAGYTNVKTDFFGATGNAINKDNFGGIMNIRWELSETLNVFIDAARQYAFEGFGDPFQILDTATLYAKKDLSDTTSVSVRLQYDHGNTALHVTRYYYTAGLQGNYKFSSHLIADVNAGYVGGKESSLGSGSFTFTEFILSAGVALSW